MLACSMAFKDYKYTVCDFHTLFCEATLVLLDLGYSVLISKFTGTKLLSAKEYWGMKDITWVMNTGDLTK